MIKHAQNTRQSEQELVDFIKIHFAGEKNSNKKSNGIKVNILIALILAICAVGCGEGSKTSRKMIDFSDKDFKKIHWTVNGKSLSNFTQCYYDFDKNKKLNSESDEIKEYIETQVPQSSGQNFIKDLQNEITARVEYLCKEGFDIQISSWGEISYITKSNDAHDYMGKTYFVLNQEYIRLNDQGKLVIPDILDKMNRMTYSEVWQNNYSINEKNVKDKIYIIKTAQRNIFICRIIDINEPLISLEVYKIRDGASVPLSAQN